jgi:Tfp pilus assembly protein PilN
VRTTLNLATRPVQNERLPALLFGVAAFVLLLVTVQHALVMHRLLPGRSKALREEVAALQKEREALEVESAGLRRVTATAAQQSEWEVLKGLVDQRTFSWSRLFVVLEDVLPPEARVLSVSPRVQKEGRGLEMRVRVQSNDVGYELMRTLEGRPEFSNVGVRSVESDAGREAEFLLVMFYLVDTGEEAPTPPPSAPAREARAAPGEAAP